MISFAALPHFRAGTTQRMSTCNMVDVLRTTAVMPLQATKAAAASGLTAC